MSYISWKSKDSQHHAAYRESSKGEWTPIDVSFSDYAPLPVAVNAASTKVYFLIPYGERQINTLYELELATGTFTHLFDGLDADLNRWITDAESLEPVGGVSEFDRSRYHYVDSANPECGGTFEITNVLKYDMLYEYDSLNRLTKQTWDYYGRDEEYSYFKNNRLATHTDGKGQTTTFDYTANNEYGSTTFRDGGVSEVTYDANGRVSGVRDALGEWTYYRQDGFGNPWEIVSPATGTTNYEFDEAGNLEKKTDARGTVLHYEYDALNRLTSTTVNNSATAIHTLEYDTDQPGHLYRVTDEAGTHTFVRNREGNVETRTDVISAETLTTSYTYDVHGRVSQMTYPSGLQVNYLYDTFGRVCSVTAQGAGLPLSNVVTGVTHFPFGAIRRYTFGNGETRHAVRNKDYELVVLTSGAHIVSRSFQRDLNGNIDAFGTRTYAYDEMDRLATHSGPDGSWEYDYDLNGNRVRHKENSTQTTYNYDATKSRLVSLTGGTSESRQYDDNGNTIQIGNRYSDYNDLNRFWRYREGSLTVTYKHNAFGERQLKQNGSTTTRFVYEGPSLLHERTGSTNRDYIYLAGNVVGMVKNGVLYYVHNDHLGRPEVITNSAKSVVWDSQNNAFGNTPGTDVIGNFNIGFPGQFYYIESGTHYNYYRTYDGLTGPYLQSAPIGLVGGLNTYSYAASNPLAFIDPYGLKDEPFDPRRHGPRISIPGTQAPIIIGGEPNPGAYNCHSDAWHLSFGDWTDPLNWELMQMGVPRWDNSPEREMATRICTVVLATLLLGFSAADTNYHVLGRTELEKYTAETLIEFLVSAKHGHVVMEEQVPDWVDENCIPYLVELATSDNRPSMSVKLMTSSYFGDGRSSVSNEAHFMLLGFKHGKYPPALNSTRHTLENLDEVLVWLDEQGLLPRDVAD